MFYNGIMAQYAIINSDIIYGDGLTIYFLFFLYTNQFQQQPQPQQQYAQPVRMNFISSIYKINQKFVLLFFCNLYLRVVTIGLQSIKANVCSIFSIL